MSKDCNSPKRIGGNERERQLQAGLSRGKSAANDPGNSLKGEAIRQALERHYGKKRS